MTTRLFVYGTLAPGRENAHFLKSLRGRWEKASVKGVLYPYGIGPTLGYPALRIDAAGAVVDGLLFTSDELPTLFPELDAFEGEGYCRELVMVTRDNGERIEAWAYCLDGAYC